MQASQIFSKAHSYNSIRKANCFYQQSPLKPTRWAMCIQCNNEARMCNHSCGGNAIHITHSESVFVALGIQHAMCMCHIVICWLSSSTVFFHIIS